MTRHQLIVDCETTDLAADYQTGSGVIWELAILDRTDGSRHLWRMEPDLAKASPQALAVGRFYERTEGMRSSSYPSLNLPFDLASPPPPDGAQYWSDPAAVAAAAARLLDGATLIIAVPAFDDPYLKAFLRHYGQAPTWHYRSRDIGSMAWGFLRGRAHGHQFLAGEGYDGGAGDLPAAVPPADASTDDFARALGVDPECYERHSALGDCLLLEAMLGVIEGAFR